MKSYELIEFINNCPKEIKKELKNRSFKYGEKLLVQNENCDFVYILLKGKIKTYHCDFTGAIYLEDIDSEATIFGELEALINKEVVTTVEALSQCETLEISKESFIKWIELDNKFSLFINNIELCQSFQYPNAINIPIVASAGLTNGNITFINIVKSPAPSILADSVNACGIPLI